MTKQSHARSSHSKLHAKSPRPSPAPKGSASGLAVAESTRVFISYRREPTEPAAAYLRHSLGASLGEEKIFRDLDTLQPGQKFEAAIGEAIRNTTVCLVLIGPSWLALRGARGTRRLTEKGDYVRIEIETALKAGVEIIPLLIDGAKMPSRRELPGSIAELAGRNAYELPWATGIAKLSDRIRQRCLRRCSEAQGRAGDAGREDALFERALKLNRERPDFAVRPLADRLRELFDSQGTLDDVTLASLGTAFMEPIFDLARPCPEAPIVLE